MQLSIRKISAMILIFDFFIINADVEKKYCKSLVDNYKKKV